MASNITHIARLEIPVDLLVRLKSALRKGLGNAIQNCHSSIIILHRPPSFSYITQFVIIAKIWSLGNQILSNRWHELLAKRISCCRNVWKLRPLSESAIIMIKV